MATAKSITKPDVKPIPYALAKELAETLQNQIYVERITKKEQKKEPQLYRVKTMIVGSIRRESPEIYDIDLILLTDEHIVITDGPVTVTEWPLTGERIERLVVSYTSPTLGTVPKIKVDLFYVHEGELPYALFHYTGTNMYNIRTRSQAKKRGLKLNQYGIFMVDHNGNATHRARGTAHFTTEKEIAEYLGLSYKLPKDRKR